MSRQSVELPSAAFFNPQSKAYQEDYLDTLQLYLVGNDDLRPLVQAIAGLPKVWEIYAGHRKEIAVLPQGPLYTRALSNWIATGRSCLIANTMSACLALPLLTITQTCQYFQFLHLRGLKHYEFLEVLRAGGGIHGYCAGLLPALAIATSANEAELVENACKALRIALGIGAYADLGDEDTSSGPTNLVIRLKYEGQGEEIIKNYTGAYISAVTDPKTISIVGPGSVLAEIKAYADRLGLLSQGMHIRGKVHNPENNDFAAELSTFCDQHTFLQYPSSAFLKVPVRSNQDGELCGQSSLTHEVIRTILASRCEWYQLLTNVSRDLEQTRRQAHVLINFGIGDCISPVPFNMNGLQITKLNAMSFITENSSMREPKARAAYVHPSDAIPMLESQARTTYVYPSDAIAVVGAACRLPGANSVHELWDVLASGSSTVGELPQERFDTQRSFRISQDRKWASNRRFYGNFIDRPDSFDNAFFKISPREATSMDPQQRLVLETAYQALESSGYLRSHRRESGDRVGVFVGASFVEYLANTSSHPPTAYTAMGTLSAFLCGRVSHQFGWTGPAEVIDTACSSSLVAINRACKAIQNGECPMALAGGVNVITALNNFLDLGKAGFLSPTGQCKPFDASADGYCRAEGVGLVVLKSLSQAIKEGDQILGVVSGAATNQGGQSSSITVPDSAAQVELFQDILRKAKLAPDQVTYVEAHGTGTQAGDPIEVASIRKVFGDPRRVNALQIGSIKGNIGHCETAAGVAGFIKALLLLDRGSIPPLASHNTLNSSIPSLSQDGMAVSSHLEPWRTSFRAVCVNSYGAAGSNAAVLLCQRPELQTDSQQKSTQGDISYPLILSADSEASLSAYATDLKRYIEGPGSAYSVADVAFTLAEKRRFHRLRWATNTSNLSELTRALKNVVSDYSEAPSEPKRVVLVFSGQTGSVVGLDKALYDSSGLLRYHLQKTNDVLLSLGFQSLIPAIFEPGPISDIKILQCGLFAVQYSVAKCWIDSGLHVDTVVGHSFGELTALAVSGILSLKDALTVVAGRASLMENKWGPEHGAMLAIRGPVEAIQGLIMTARTEQNELEIACFNSDTNHVVVGTESSITNAERILKEDPKFSGLQSNRLNVTHGFHSRFTDSILDDLDKLVQPMIFGNPQIPFEACTLEPQGLMSFKHISQHARFPVYFNHAIRRIEKRLGDCVWLEAGSDSPVISMVKKAVETPNEHIFHAMKTRTEEQPMSAISKITNQLWRDGISLSFWNFCSSHSHGLKQIWLPPYHFQQTRHWLPYVDRTTEALESSPPTGGIRSTESEPREEKKIRKILTQQTHDQRQGVVSFTINTANQRYIDIITGHAVLRRPLCPAAMYMECAVTAAQTCHKSSDRQALWFEKCSFEAPLGIDPRRDVFVQIQADERNTAWSFTIQSASRGDIKPKVSIHAKGRLGFGKESQTLHYQTLVPSRVEALSKASNLESLRSDKAYRLFSRIVDYSAIFQGISLITFTDTEAVATIETRYQPEPAESAVGSICDTVSIDTFLQVCGLLINCDQNCSENDAFLAVGVGSVSGSLACNFQQCRKWTVYTVFTLLNNSKATGDIFVMRSDGTLAMTILGVQFSKIPLTTLERLLDSSNAPSSKISSPNRRNVANGQSIQPMSSSSDSDPNSAEISSPSTPGSLSPNEELEDLNDSVHADELRRILAPYGGLSEHQIKNTTIMGEIGIDSLAAIELVDELASKFGKEVSGADVVNYDFKTLSNVIGIGLTSQKPRPSNPLDRPVISRKPSSTLVQSGVQSRDSDWTARQRLVELISNHSGCPTSAVGDDSSLQDLGIDSLSKIELKAEIENVFEIDIEDGHFTTETTVRNLLKELGASAHFQTTVESSLGDLSGPPTPYSELTTPGRNGTDESYIGVDPIELLAECDGSLDSSAKKYGFVDYWANVAPAHDELLLVYIAEALRCLGTDLWQMKTGQPIPKFTYSAKHTKLMQRLSIILERLGITSSVSGQAIRTSKPVPETPSTVLYERLITSFPEYANDARLMAVTAPFLAGCLVGKTDPLALLFGNPRAQKILGDFYRDSPMFATLTDHLVNFTGRMFARKHRGTIKILEVGAGFGGTTTLLAEKLQESGQDIEYTFTDISSTLVEKARKIFSKYRWMDFQILNIEQDPPARLQEKYDIVIGTNVVHATANLVDSCGNMRGLLKRGGFVCLSEITRVIDWHNLVFGLLSGWWSFNDGRTYALQSAEAWMSDLKNAGFTSTSFSSGSSQESQSQQLLIGSTRPCKEPTRASHADSELRRSYKTKTVVYKEVDDIQIHADVYLPSNPSSNQAMPIALMIHGGGFMTLSKTAIRPAQTAFLLDQGILPVSLDHRLCPEINLVDGPMADVRDALSWAQSDLVGIAQSHGIKVDPTKIVVIGWSTGGHLAMTTAWTSLEAGISPPKAILNFYGPSDFEALGSNRQLGTQYPGRSLSMESIRKSLSTKPITHYDSSGAGDSTNLGWIRPGDPRSELVLSLFKDGNGLNLLLNGLNEDNWKHEPSTAQINAINPIAQVSNEKYRVPTFSIHGDKDEIVPCDMSIAFDKELRAKGVKSGLLVVKGAKHIHDLNVEPESKEWEMGVGPAYDFVLEILGKSSNRPIQ